MHGFLLLAASVHQLLLSQSHLHAHLSNCCNLDKNVSSNRKIISNMLENLHQTKCLEKKINPKSRQNMAQSRSGQMRGNAVKKNQPNF